VQGIEGMMKKSSHYNHRVYELVHGKRTIVERLLDDIFDAEPNLKDGMWKITTNMEMAGMPAGSGQAFAATERSAWPYING
jgi:hypothetical protein